MAPCRPKLSSGDDIADKDCGVVATDVTKRDGYLGTHGEAIHPAKLLLVEVPGVDAQAESRSSIERIFDGDFREISAKSTLCQRAAVCRR